MKQRAVNTDMWVDGWVQELEPNAKLLFVFFLTNPHTNIAGIYEITIKTIVFHTGLERDEVDEIMEQFEKDKKVFREQNFIIMTNHLKHQKLNPNMLTSVRKIIHELPEYVRDSEGFELYGEIYKSNHKVELI